MPAYLTHYIFADKNTKKDAEYRNIILLGSQGSDPFFYYGYKIFGSRKLTNENREFGTNIHHIDLTDFFEFMINRINKSNNEEKAVLKAYITGFIMHYCVDRNCHPYVFYRSGFACNKDESKKYAYIHSLFESRIDSLFMKKKGYRKIDPSLATKAKTKCLKIISLAYYDFAREVMKNPSVFPLSFVYAVKDMETANHLLHSKTGTKKKFFEKHFKYSLLNSMSTPKSVNDDSEVDYLNLKHAKWIHPVTGEPSNKSFLDLIENAKYDFDEGIKLLDCKVPTVLRSKILAFVRQINHDGCLVNSRMSFSNCFYTGDFQ